MIPLYQLPFGLNRQVPLFGYPFNEEQLEYDYRRSKCPQGPFLEAPALGA